MLARRIMRRIDGPTMDGIHAQAQQDVGQPDFDPTPGGSRPGWAVVETYSRDEQKAELGLREQHFQTFLPQLWKHEKLRALYPGYLFLWLEPDTQWRPVGYTAGVVKLLKTADGRPQLVPEGVVELLQSTEAMRRKRVQPASWTPGMACSVQLAGIPQEAVVLEVGKHNAIVATLLMGEMRRLNARLSQLGSYQFAPRIRVRL